MGETPETENVTIAPVTGFPAVSTSESTAASAAPVPAVRQSEVACSALAAEMVGVTQVPPAQLPARSAGHGRSGVDAVAGSRGTGRRPTGRVGDVADAGAAEASEAASRWTLAVRGTDGARPDGTEPLDELPLPVLRFPVELAELELPVEVAGVPLLPPIEPVVRGVDELLEVVAPEPGLPDEPPSLPEEPALAGFCPHATRSDAPKPSAIQRGAD